MTTLNWTKIDSGLYNATSPEADCYGVHVVYWIEAADRAYADFTPGEDFTPTLAQQRNCWIITKDHMAFGETSTLREGKAAVHESLSF